MLQKPVYYYVKLLLTGEQEMKVLILSTGTGEGHNSAGKAVKEQFDKRGIPCVMADALTFASDKAAYYGRKIYVWSTVKATRVFSGAYKAGRAISSSRRKSPVYYANALYAGRLYRYITDHGFDTIVMPHLFPAEAVTYMTKKYQPAVKTYFIATDYTCIPFTEETEMDYYFLPHEDLKEEFRARGLPDEKLVATGIPVSEEFQKLLSGEEARKKLGIGRSDRCLLVMTGSMGYGNIEKLVGILAVSIRENDRIYVLGGTNETLKERLRECYDNDSRVEILDYIDNPREYLAAADILFSKPGGLTSTEAVVAGIPLVHTGPIPGCEEKNAAFFSTRGMAVTDKSEEMVARRGLDLLDDRYAAQQMLEQQRLNCNPHAAEDICRFILEHGYAGRAEDGYV